MNNKRSAFTLVELAIVIVIVGLLVSGVLVGKELIEQSRIRSVIKEYESITTVFTVFKDKYKGLPGDLPTGSAYFSNCSMYNSNCNGDGNQLFDDDWVTGDPSRVWPHLVLAKLLPDRIKSAREYYISQSYSIATWWTQANAGNTYSPSNTSAAVANFQSNKNYLYFTGHLNGVSRDLAVITPASAQTIDTKLDDGLPQTGKVMSGAGSANNTQPCLGSGNDYLSSLDATTCMMIFDLPD